MLNSCWENDLNEQVDSELCRRNGTMDEDSDEIEWQVFCDTHGLNASVWGNNDVYMYTKLGKLERGLLMTGTRLEGCC